MTEHTPGPWTSGNNGADPSQLVIGAAGKGYGYGYHVASIPTRQRGIAEIDEVNARLIASAPDLLAALEGLADYWEAAIKGTPDVANDYASDGFAIMQQARAAIAKAKGK